MKRCEVVRVYSNLVAVVDCPLAEYFVTIQGPEVQRVDPQLVAVVDCPFAEYFVTIQGP